MSIDPYGKDFWSPAAVAERERAVQGALVAASAHESAEAGLICYAQILDQRDAENPVRCSTCRGAHGAVWVCGGCEEPESDCVCFPKDAICPTCDVVLTDESGDGRCPSCDKLYRA